MTKRNLRFMRPSPSGSALTGQHGTPSRPAADLGSYNNARAVTMLLVQDSSGP